MEELENKYDLIIARDIIEHVSDAGTVIKNLHSYLKPNGLFHFTTPNGHEDRWRFYLTQKLYNKPAELLINHVNYFDGSGLKDFLKQTGFTQVRYYTFKIKTTIKGWGWRTTKKFAAAVSTHKKANETLSKKHLLPESNVTMDDVMSKWYISSRHKWFTYLYSWYQHHSIVILPPRLNRGHEIYGIFRKT
jgi:SAM-dependent methyltransferase